MREKREAWCERVSAMKSERERERERDERPRKEKSVRLKGFGDGWVNWQQWRERERMREKREAWCEKEFQRWRERERDERPWRERTDIYA